MAKRQLYTLLMLVSILLCVLCFSSCGGFDGLCTTILAVLGSISVALTAASLHNSQAAIPLMRMTSALSGGGRQDVVPSGKGESGPKFG